MTDDGTEAGDAPSDTMRRRGDGNRLTLRVLLETNRWVVAGGVVAAFLLGTLVTAAVLPAGALVDAGDPVETLFQALVTATITGVTLVVSINSLVLSRELGPLGDQRDRMEGSMSFRRDVEEELGVDVTPASPAAFLGELVAAVEDRSHRLSAAVAVADAESGVDADAIEEYARELERHASAVGAELSGRQFGTFDVLSAALNFNYSWKISEARRLRAGLDAGSGESEPAVEAVASELDAIVAALTLFGPAREHVKTLYFRWELVDLSRAILYTAVPAVVVAINVLLFHDALAGIPGTALGITLHVWVVAAATAVAMVPFAVLLAYVLRLGTVAKRTLSIGPFILRTRSGERRDGGS
jgi:hypothetical protein